MGQFFCQLILIVPEKADLRTGKKRKYFVTIWIICPIFCSNVTQRFTLKIILEF